MAIFTRLVSEPLPRPPPVRRPAYPSDVTDEQWRLLEPLLERNAEPAEAGGPGRPTEVDLREIVNALLYMKPTGCQWRYLPHDLPPRSTVHYYFAQWTVDGTLEEVTRQLREHARGRAKRSPRPTAGVIDSQTVQSTGASVAVGWDGGK